LSLLGEKRKEREPALIKEKKRGGKKAVVLLAGPGEEGGQVATPNCLEGRRRAGDLSLT